MAWHIERGVIQSCRMVLQDPHDYEIVAHTRLRTIEFLQYSHCCLYDSEIVCMALPKLIIIT